MLKIGGADRLSEPFGAGLRGRNSPDERRVAAGRTNARLSKRFALQANRVVARSPAVRAAPREYWRSR
jgi:hypothetical protein